MIWTASQTRNRFSQRSLSIATTSLLIALAGCDGQPTNTTCVLVGCDGQPTNTTCVEVSGVLQCTCKSGYADCDNTLTNGCETNRKTDANNCGACGISCTSPLVCTNGHCDSGDANCPGVDLATHPFHCGACNVSVDDKNACTDDSCVNGLPVYKNRPKGNWCYVGVCDANGQCMRNIGVACSTNAQCESGFCADGFCCNEACDGTCESCAKAETGVTDGTCWPILAVTDPAAECLNGECNGVGQCVPSAIACTTPADCASGFCADGYCCNSPCTDSCMVCNAPANLGFCIPIPILGDDPNASVPCAGPTVSCNGNGVCKGDVGQTCVTNTDCLSGHCNAGLCGPAITQSGPLDWEWHVDTTSIADPMLAYSYAEVNISEMVAMNDGRTQVVGNYYNQIFGMYSGGYDHHDGNTTAYTHNETGPHLFVFDLDANAQTGTFGELFYGVNLWDKLSFSEYSEYRWYSKGLTLWRAGGNAGGYFEGWKYANNTKVFMSSDECTSGWFHQSGPPSWSLGSAETCSLQAWTIAGDESGNTFARSAAGISHYDQIGQMQQVIPDPFSGPDGKLSIGPQGEFHLGARDSSAVRISKANASGMLQWTKTVPAPMFKGANDCFSYALDAAGNILLAFHSQVVADLGNGPLPPLGPLDLVLAKLDPQSNLVWARRFGGLDFKVKSCSLKSTGLDALALLLDSTGTVDLGDGVLPSSPVLVKFDAMGSLVWRADLTSHFPFVPEQQTWAISGHPSGAIFTSGTGHAQTPPSWATPRDVRFLVAKYGP